MSPEVRSGQVKSDPGREGVSEGRSAGGGGRIDHEHVLSAKGNYQIAITLETNSF